jgi:hypothetical protein
MSLKKEKNSDEQFYSLLSSLKRETIAPDSKFLNELRERSAKEFQAGASRGSASSQESANIIFRKIIMKSRFTKLAIAAAILIAFGVGFSVGRWTQPPQSEPPSFDVTAYTSVIQLYPTTPKTEDSFWRQKALAAMQPKLYVQNQITKTNLIDAYKKYLKEKHYD